MLCVVKVLFAADSAVNGRIEPKYSGIEYNALAALFVKVKVVVHLTVKAAELIVSESVPERDYMVFKLIFTSFISILFLLLTYKQLLRKHAEHIFGEHSFYFKSLPQQFLYFLPLPHGQGSFLPTFFTRRGSL